MEKEDEIIDLIHQEDLKIFKFFQKICNENNLKYYAIGGTFLGTIRHKGFIPWDDDMDIAMPRKDYDKFIEIFKENNYEFKLYNYKLTPEYKFYISRLCNPKYKMTEISGYETELFIDIFPIDGMPSNKFIRNIHYIRIFYHKLMLSFYYNDTIDMNMKRKPYEKILIKIAKMNLFKKFINPNKQKDKIDKLLKMYSFQTAKYSGTIMGTYKTKEIVETELFGKATLYPFEDTFIYGPEKYDEYLTHMYGSYMKLPKEEDRRIHCKEIKRVEGKK